MRLGAGVFCHNGLGDGVNTLCLSHNLHLNGWQVDTYHNSIGSMQEWFPHLKVVPYPSIEELPKILTLYDYFFVVNNNTDPFVLQLIQEGKRRFPDRLKVIYLYPSNRIINERYYSDCLTEPQLSVAENLRLFCERILHLPKISRGNGIIPPTDLVHRKFSKRIVMHPTSGNMLRNWPRAKFVKLALHLQEEGYQIVFAPGNGKIQETWKEGLETKFEVVSFKTFDLLARFLYESGYLIGNDSGLGHLASSLGVPTLTFFRNKKHARMWAPSFTRKIVVTPHPWIPNIRGLRLRDRYWKQLISVTMAKRAFQRLLKKCSNH